MFFPYFYYIPDNDITSHNSYIKVIIYFALEPPQMLPKT